MSNLRNLKEKITFGITDGGIRIVGGGGGGVAAGAQEKEDEPQASNFTQTQLELELFPRTLIMVVHKRSTAENDLCFTSNEKNDKFFIQNYLGN